ncbi:MAG: DMT family transporter [Candidatus Eremiobacteraeota bacterium]|nr:DMT family transporter [Candidatus Eremiobacteraeota bacterium]MBC5804211.1 DMT family transporter [Candidatus Eremiobacteraeota bacterium]MBC5822589.1 DMT family transporter [Candidatus Eremiobacteraeota bacterium]
MAIGLALAAALVYGAADFFGGLASRRTPAAAVVVLSQIAGIAVLALAWLALPGHFYASDIMFGVLAGVAGGVAIAALYAALAVGRMGVVSPITAVVGASVPVIVGLSSGERPTVAAMAGLAAALVAVTLVSAGAGLRRFSFAERGVGLALLSGLGIGALYVFLARGHPDAGLARLAVTRIVSMALLSSYVLMRRESLRPAPDSVRLILLAGALDMSANILYVIATRFGLLAIVAVITSLYPASTVFLARIVLRERLTATQWIGVVFAAWRRRAHCALRALASRLGTQRSERRPDVQLRLHAFNHGVREFGCRGVASEVAGGGSAVDGFERGFVDRGRWRREDR